MRFQEGVAPMRQLDRKWGRQHGGVGAECALHPLIHTFYSDGQNTTSWNKARELERSYKVNKALHELDCSDFRGTLETIWNEIWETAKKPEHELTHYERLTGDKNLEWTPRWKGRELRKACRKVGKSYIKEWENDIGRRDTGVGTVPLTVC
jgi:hypothetical protein